MVTLSGILMMEVTVFDFMALKFHLIATELVVVDIVKMVVAVVRVIIT